MFARFKIEAVTSSEGREELVGVGIVMPTGEAYVDWKNPEIVNKKEMGGPSWKYDAGISQVIDIVDDFKSVEFDWIDDPSGGGYDE
jgi:hypothetical protein